MVKGNKQRKQLLHLAPATMEHETAVEPTTSESDRLIGLFKEKLSHQTHELAQKTQEITALSIRNSEMSAKLAVVEADLHAAAIKHAAVEATLQ
jgi:hypothetical protein